MRWLFILLFLVPIVSASNESFVQLKEELHQPYESGESFYSLTFLVGIFLLFFVFYYGQKQKNHKHKLIKLKN